MLGSVPRGIRVKFIDGWMGHWKGRIVDLSPATFQKLKSHGCVKYEVLAGLPEEKPAPEPPAVPDAAEVVEAVVDKPRRRRRKSNPEAQA